MRNAAAMVHISPGSLTLELKRCVGRFFIFSRQLKLMVNLYIIISELMLPEILNIRDRH